MKLRILCSFVLFSLVVIIVTVSGCTDGIKYSTVTGKVTQDGQPVAAIGIKFDPTNAPAGHGAPGTALTNERGEYKVFYVGGTPKIPEGPYKVRVFEPEDGATLRGVVSTEREIATVKGGRTVFDIELSKP